MLHQTSHLVCICSLRCKIIGLFITQNTADKILGIFCAVVCALNGMYMNYFLDLFLCALRHSFIVLI
jgi:hypothetical protein